MIGSAQMGWAQPSGYVPVKNLTDLKQNMAKNYSQNKTIAADFFQIKSMKLLSEELKSKGKFYFQQPEKLRIQYVSPYQYLVVYNQGLMLVKDESKSNKINTKSSKSMQSLNRIMLDCMSGRVFDNKDFKTT